MLRILCRAACLSATIALPGAAANAAGAISVDGWRMDGNLVSVEQMDPAEGPSDFNKAIGEYHQKGKTISCSKVLSMPMGSVETLYGGICLVQFEHAQSVQNICYDTGVGEFEMQPALKGIDPTAALVQFVFDHCPGG